MKNKWQKKGRCLDCNEEYLVGEIGIDIKTGKFIDDGGNILKDGRCFEIFCRKCGALYRYNPSSGRITRATPEAGKREGR